MFKNILLEIIIKNQYIKCLILINKNFLHIQEGQNLTKNRHLIKKKLIKDYNIVA